jgi:hypothetical protein
MKTLLLTFMMTAAYVVSAQQSPDFSPNHDVEICGPNNVYFVCTAPASPDNIWWDFGDNTTGTGLNPVHYYATTGTYDVKMIIQVNGVKDSITKTAFVTVKPQPESAFRVDSSQMKPHPFTRKMVFSGFSNAQSIDTYMWKVNGEDIVCNAPVLNHQFSGNGSYTVSLTVVNNAGCQDEFSRTVDVFDEPDPHVGIDEHMKKNGFYVSALTDHEELLVGRSVVNENAKIRIIDISGRTVLVKEMNAGEDKTTVQLNGMPGGTYIIEYSSVSSVAAKRFSRIML